MNQEPQNYTLTQISFLVKNLSRKSLGQKCSLLAQFVKDFSLEADRHHLRCLFKAINFLEPTKTSIHCHLFRTKIIEHTQNPKFISDFCYVLDNSLLTHRTLNRIIRTSIVTEICKAVGIPIFGELAISIAFAHSLDVKVSGSSINHFLKLLPKLIDFYIKDEQDFELQYNLTTSLSIDLLFCILWEKNLVYRAISVNYNKFIEKIREQFANRVVPLVLIPYLYGESELEITNILNTEENIFSKDSSIMETSWSNLILEVGYMFTASVDDCKSHLSKLYGREVQAQDVAKIIGVMCRTHSGVTDLNINIPTSVNFWPGHTEDGSGDKKEIGKGDCTQQWKPDCFVQALREIIPSLNWKEVCMALDHPEFCIKDRVSLNLLLTIIRLGCLQAGYTYLVDSIYRHWQNMDSQFHLLCTIFKCSDMLSFADYIYTPVATDLLKTPPETDNKNIMQWKSLHLIDVILYLGDHGYMHQVLDLLKFPIQHCPDVLFMGMMQTNVPMTTFRQELFAILLPTFFGNHPNSGVVLHHAWNGTNYISFRPIIMLALSEWYTRGENDQSRLSRILDVAQDLKALSNLLNIRSYMFIIDLACLASRREYLKLEKWLSDKIREHGEAFVEALVKFLQRRCPYITGSKIPDEIPKSAQLPHETLTTILTCLQTCIGNIQQELSEMIIQMTQNCNILVHKARQQAAAPPGVLRTHRGLDATTFNNSLNAQQMFGPTVDSMSALNTSIAGLSLGAPNAGFNFGNVIGSLVSTPASPSRLLQAPSNSPFAMMSMQAAPPNVSNLARMQPTPPTADKILIPTAPGLMADLNQALSKEVEDEANSYFQRIYNHPPHATLSIDDVLDMLQRFKDSNIRREQEVYQCMLRNLFEEYRFFPQYPDKELQVTAQLFGGIIERNLVPTCVALGLALRCVLDALRKPEGSKMYYFGLAALDRFKTRLHQYNKYCEYVRNIPHFQEFPPTLIQYVEYGYQSLEPPKPQCQTVIPQTTHMVSTQPTMLQSQPDAHIYRSSSVTGNLVTTPTQATKSIISQVIPPTRVKSIATATNIDTLLVATVADDKMTVPPDAIQDKTAFIFNNLSQLNLQQKCEEIKEIMTKEYWPWLAQYLVLKRASIELNFHPLYSNFLDALKNSEIFRLVTQETYRNIKVLLRSDKGIANFSDRSLLKNLGHWLGMITIARNKPVLQIDIDLKALLVEAYHKGQQELLYVVPFVAKILESCAKSKAFKPRNPWTMGLMYVLGELHQEPDLKLNLKFEIEVLCKTLGININTLKPIVYLKDPERALSIEYQMSQPTVSKPKEPAPTVEEQVIAINSTVPSNVSPNISSENAGQISICNPPEPRFNYTDFNVSSYNTISQFLVVSPNLTIVHSNPPLRHIIVATIERTISEWLPPVMERSVRIGVLTCEHIIRKDFALDPDETRMRTAAQYMVRNLTAGLAMITCKDQLIQLLQVNLKKALSSVLIPPSNILDVEAAVTQLTNDNVELACAFIQKTATEKASPELDRHLAPDFEMRKLAREDGRRYCDSDVLTYQSERMPEHIRLKVGCVPITQFAVYEEFARNIPGFQFTPERDQCTYVTKFPALQETPHQSFGTDDLGIMYAELVPKMDSFITSAVNVSALQVQVTKMHSMLNTLVATRRNRETESALNLLSRAVEGLIEGYVNIPEHAEQMKLYRDIHLRILNFLQHTFGSAATARVITKCIFECRDEIRYNFEAIKLLINSHLINIQQFDVLLFQAIDNGANFLAIAFAMQFVQYYLIDERASNIVTDTDLSNTTELLAKLTVIHNRGPEGLGHLIEVLRLSNDPNPQIGERLPTGPLQVIHMALAYVKANDCDNPIGFQEKAEYLLKDWVTSYTHNNPCDINKTFQIFANKVTTYGILKTDDLITRFFKMTTQFCMDLVYRSLNDPNYNPVVTKPKILTWIDAFVKMIVMLIRHATDNAGPVSKVNLLHRILGVVTGVLFQDQELHGVTFQQLGYHRFFITFFMDLSTTDPVFENLIVGVVSGFSHVFHLLNPASAPGFGYAWLELISHRLFMSKILSQIPQQRGWSLYAQLLLDLFKFLAPFLRNAEMAKPVQLFYKGTLRVLLVLLHDFPEFLCDYHFGFCDVIPPNCVQMRNIILAAFPRNMRLPDPFTPNLRPDALPETNTAPRIYTNYVANIQPINFKNDLDSYLKARSPVTFLSELRGHLQISNEPGSKYNIPLMNSLVLYVGAQAITLIRSKNMVPNMSTIVHSAHMDIFQNLAVDLDNEGRYLYLNAIANQLRYPNSHTHYFSCALLYLFAESNSEAIQEQITRVLLERLIVNRPHPWGLLITFIELIKNPIYKFWEHEFVHCAPEIEKLFESVARSCMVKANYQQSSNMEDETQECN